MLRDGGMPGPRMPRPLQGVRFLLTEHRMLERYRRRYGDVFALDVWPFDPLVVVADPAEVRRIFTGDPKQLHAGEGNRVLEPLVGGESVLVLDEAAHLKTRKKLLPPFHGERMRVYGDVMRELADAEIDTWPVGEELPLLPAMQHLTLRIILRTVFGLEEGERMEALERELITLTRRAARIVIVPSLQRDLGPLSPAGRFERSLAQVDGLLLDEIARRRRSGERGEDVLSMLMDGSSDQELRDHLVTLLVAGHETTATQLAWTMERLLRHPEALARAREEAQGEEHAYRDAVVQEAQRLRPVLTYVMRTLKAPMEVGGFTAPAGATLGTSITLMHRRADLFPEPLAFRPERFLERKAETYAWVPFGGGVRRCLGAAFATFEMRQVLGRILRRCELEAAGPANEGRRRRGITFVPARGARARLLARQPA
jgi:cytochrome P450 family 135